MNQTTESESQTGKSRKSRGPLTIIGNEGRRRMEGHQRFKVGPKTSRKGTDDIRAIGSTGTELLST